MGGNVTLMASLNTTPWTLTAEAFFSTPMGKDVWKCRSLGKFKWQPSIAVCWPVSKELWNEYKTQGGQITLNVEYEPVHKNAGTVNGCPVGEKIIVRGFDYTPANDEVA
jgi:hypothetical protein